MIKPCERGAGFLLSILISLIGASMVPTTLPAAECRLTGAQLFAMDNESDDILPSDVDGDGNIDLILQENDFMTVALGDGAGGFVWGSIADAMGNMYGNMVEADFNGDGHKDLAACRTWLEILLHDGVDGFEPGEFYITVSRAVTMAAGLFNGDDEVDLAAVTDDEELFVLFGVGDGTFLVQPEVLLPDTISDSATSDLNADGQLDLVLGVEGFDTEKSLLVLLGNGDGTFGPPSPFGDSFIYAFKLHDLDGDGKQDVAALTHDDELILFSGMGDGTFVQGPTIVVGGITRDLDVGDLDGDGAPDIAVSVSPEEIVMVLNDGEGAFTVEGSIPMCTGMADLLVTDLNGDGAADLAAGFSIAWGPYGGPAVLLNRGDGSFPTAAVYDGGTVSQELVVEDLDLDGIPDLALVASSSPYDSLEIHRGLGDGSFVQHAVYQDVLYQFICMDSGDFNGDGLPDLAISGDAAGGPFRVYFGTGDGYFGNPVAVPTSYTPDVVTAVSLNGDEMEDLVLLEWNTDEPFIEVYLGSAAGPPQFHAHYDYTVGLVTRRDIFTGDFNGDGRQDVAVLTQTDESNGAWAIFLGNGDGSLTDPTYILHEQEMENGVCGDLDNDGILDLGGVSAHWLPRTCYLFSGNGDGTFTYTENFYLEYSADRIVAGDLDKDGRNELVVVEDTDNVVAVVSRENGDFTRQALVPVGDNPGPTHLSDLDGDADLDLLLVSGGKVWVLENRLNVPVLAAGPGPGPGNRALVRTFSTEENGALLREWTAYGGGGYGVNVTFGDLDGDSWAEVVTGPGPGPIYGPHVRGFSVGGAPIQGLSFLAYGTNKFGVNVACGDIDADGFAEIITGAGPGAVFGPHVRGWNWDGDGAVGAIPGISYFAYGTPKWGVNVSCGDIDGDGFDEIVTGAGPGAVYGPHVRAWNWDGGPAVSPIGGVSYFAYGTLKYGVNVACGDIDGDGIDEIVTGAGPGAVFGPHVRGWNWDGSGAAAAIPGVSFFAYEDLHWGVNVSCGDLDSDGIDEILTGRGPGVDYSARVRGWNFDGGVVTPLATVDFQAFDGTTHGVQVGTARH
jgi:hypothetical protein